ncbi:ATP-binding protein [Paenibacillus sp. y28]|uniref:ATP-binding protein n=1 Tax=Paenibacillus sp. y28 TaxID=3129110 RepID=UPI00301837CA
MVEQLQLPAALQRLLTERQQAAERSVWPESRPGIRDGKEGEGSAAASAKWSSLIGTPGYRAPEEAIAFDALTALLLGKNVLLKGPTGSGKTKLAESLSALLGQPLHSVNCSVDLDAESLLGFKTLIQHEGAAQIEYVPGPIVKAMTHGHLLYIDEINMAKPETLPILNGALDYRRALTNPFTGELVRAAPGFGVIAAMNEGYVGTLPLNEALKNRFVMIDVPYLQGEDLKRLLREQSALAGEEQLERFVQLSSDILELCAMGQLSDEAASIRALLDACDLTVYLPPLRAIERAMVSKLSDEREQAAVRHLAKTLF